MQPSLSELNIILASQPEKPKFQTLCDNIFDVPRSELLNVLETLQEAFWSDEIDTSTAPASPACTPSTADNQDEQSRKRLRLITESTQFKRASIPTQDIKPIHAPAHTYEQPMSPSPPPSPPRPSLSEPVYTTSTQQKIEQHNTDIPPLHLWTVKYQLFCQLRSNRVEDEIIDLWQRFQHQGTKTEIQHMARYLLPVACSMRRWTVANTLRQVLLH